MYVYIYIYIYVYVFIKDEYYDREQEIQKAGRCHNKRTHKSHTYIDTLEKNIA